MYYFYILILLGIIIYYIWFRIRYSKPMTSEEILQFAKARRIQQINEYYSFPKVEYNIDKDFKKKMKPSGKFYIINESLNTFPAIAAALLKYKKHEWIILAFEKNRKVDLIWVNKGFDNKSAGLFVDFDDVLKMAFDKKYNTIIMFHNNPNNNPNIYDCTKPSKTDLNTAEKFWGLSSKKDLNLVKYVCERGISYRYFLNTVDRFYNLEEIVQSIRSKNNVSKTMNYVLYKERMKLANSRIIMN